MINGLTPSDLSRMHRMGVDTSAYEASYAVEKAKTDAMFEAFAKKREAAAKTPAVDPAVNVTLSPAAQDAVSQARNTTPSPAAASAPAVTAAPTYAKGSAESENLQMATGLAKSARNNIETMNIGVGMYNSAMRLLADTGMIDQMRQTSGDRLADVFIIAQQTIQRAGARFLTGLTDRMSQQFQVTGAALSRSADGLFQIGAYTQSASEAGWSVSVASTGQATATANGLDVSALVDDSSATGERWSSIIKTA